MKPLLKLSYFIIRIVQKILFKSKYKNNMAIGVRCVWIKKYIREMLRELK